MASRSELSSSFFFFSLGILGSSVVSTLPSWGWVVGVAEASDLAVASVAVVAEVSVEDAGAAGGLAVAFGVASEVEAIVVLEAGVAEAVSEAAAPVAVVSEVVAGLAPASGAVSGVLSDGVRRSASMSSS